MPNVEKRIRTTKNSLAKALPAGKRARFEQKLAFLKGVKPGSRFKAGAKIQSQGGW